MKRFYFTVTNDLTYDQRMIRICTSLAGAGYPVTLVGREFRDSRPLQPKAYRQKRIFCLFKKGKAFYLEFNTRLFFYLLFKRTGLVCAIDLDTILPCYFASKLKGVRRVYDAHELFCEMKEIISRPRIYRAWKRIEKYTVPKFRNGYTVNRPIADEFKKMYHVDYTVIRNMPLLRPLVIPEKKERYILYQGAVNEGRSFETLIPAMKDVGARLLIVGDGNFMKQARELVKQYQLEEKVVFTGKLPPDELYNYTINAWIGVTLFENKGLSNYLSLANRFFDYVHAGIPQLCMNYPVYHELNKSHRVAVLVEDLGPLAIANRLNSLLANPLLYQELQENCLKAREEWNWQEEGKKLTGFYQRIMT